MTQFSSLFGTRLDRELGTDDSTILFTTARRQAAINEGVEQFAELTDCWVAHSSITIVGGTAEYNLNTALAGLDFVKFAGEQVQFRYTNASSQVTILAGDDLLRRDIDWLNVYEPGWQNDTVASTTEQLPRAYYLRPDYGQMLLGFWPTPSTGSSCAADVLVPYIAKPPVLTSDTQEPFATVNRIRIDLRPFHQATVHYAAAQLEKLRRDYQASQGQLQMFLSYVQRYLQSLRRRNAQALTFSRRYFGRRTTGLLEREDPRR